ncbi:MAG: nucleotidyltransferase domain-containing protein [Gammaproteobacteria bacterium]|nr:nucleotidyltransferase domain-containing protein [Gammaproteobacteria bacterium]
MIAKVEQHLDELEQLCRQYGVVRLELFGSAASGEYQPESSDLDFLVEFGQKTQYADRYFGLLESLEQLFQSRVDLVVASAIKNPYFQHTVEETMAPLYAA